MPVVIKEGFWKNAQNFQADINDNGVRVGVDNVHKQDEKHNDCVQYLRKYRLGIFNYLGIWWNVSLLRTNGQEYFAHILFIHLLVALEWIFDINDNRVGFGNVGKQEGQAQWLIKHDYKPTPEHALFEGITIIWHDNSVVHNHGQGQICVMIIVNIIVECWSKLSGLPLLVRFKND